MTSSTLPGLPVPPPGYADSTDGGFNSGSSGVGGSGTSVRIVVCTALNFDTVGLAAGIPIYVPTPGDWLLDAWYKVATGFNGTTPQTDLALQAGFTANGGVGWLRGANTGNGPCADAEVTDGSGDISSSFAGMGQSANDSGTLSLSQAWSYAAPGPWRPVQFISDDPVIGLVSQDGNQGGAAVGGTAGSLTWRLLIGTDAT